MTRRKHTHLSTVFYQHFHYVTWVLGKSVMETWQQDIVSYRGKHSVLNIMLSSSDKAASTPFCLAALRLTAASSCLTKRTLTDETIRRPTENALDRIFFRWMCTDLKSQRHSCTLRLISDDPAPKFSSLHIFLRCTLLSHCPVIFYGTACSNYTVCIQGV